MALFYLTFYLKKSLIEVVLAKEATTMKNRRFKYFITWIRWVNQTITGKSINSLHTTKKSANLFMKKTASEQHYSNNEFWSPTQEGIQKRK